MRSLLGTAFLLLIVNAAPAAACFGPKLYLGVPEGKGGEVLQALVTLYVKEKTGTEVVAVPLEGRDPLREIAGERIDMALTAGDPGDAVVLLALERHLRLVSGPRPLTDLQFTTVAPALRKLGRLLDPRQFEILLEKADDDLSAMAAVREFLMERGWI